MLSSAVSWLLSVTYLQRKRGRLILKHSGNNFHQIDIGYVTKVSLILQRTRKLMSVGLILWAREVPPLEPLTTA